MRDRFAKLDLEAVLNLLYARSDIQTAIVAQHVVRAFEARTGARTDV